MNDFIQLRPQSNVNDAETMVEGKMYDIVLCVYAIMCTHDILLYIDMRTHLSLNLVIICRYPGGLLF